MRSEAERVQRIERAIELIEKKRAHTLEIMAQHEGIMSYMHGLDYAYHLIITAAKSTEPLP